MFTYMGAAEHMRHARAPENGRPIGNNTRLFRRQWTNGETVYSVKLHSTFIVDIHADGTYALSTGGWETITTYQRIRAWSPVHNLVRIGVERDNTGGDWYVQIRPRDDDPEAPHGRRSVPKPFVATDPGPEPVKGHDGCCAGTWEAYSYQEDDLLMGDCDYLVDDQAYANPSPGYSERVAPGLFTTGRESGVFPIAARSANNAYLFWGESHTSYNDTWYDTFKRVANGDVKYIQCPHCAAFDRTHQAWRVRYHGGHGYGNYGVDGNGYKLYAEMIERYGTQDAWREAYLADYRETRAANVLRKEWQERNWLPMYNGIRVDGDGYPMEEESNLHWTTTKATQDYERERAVFMRELKRRRKKVRPRVTFEERACIAVQLLDNINEQLGDAHAQP